MHLIMPYRYRVLILLCSLTTLTYLDRICISIVGVRLKADLGLNNEQFGWVLASFSFAYALFEIPSGMLGDRIGPKAVFIRIVLFWSLCTAATGFAGGLISLMVIRFLFGMGESGTYPNILIVISRWYPVQETGRSLTWVGIGSQIGSAIAPLLIVPLAINYGWRVPFIINAAIGIVWVTACYKWFKDFPSELKKISPVELSLIESNRRFSTTQHLISWKIIFRNPTVWGLMLMYFCCQCSNYFFITWMPVYLQEGRHFSENAMKLITTLVFVVGIGGFLSGGLMADILSKRFGLKYGRRAIGVTGLSCCGLLIFMTAIFNQPVAVAACIIGANFCFAFSVMISYAVCADIGRNNAGTVTGAMNFFGQTGGLMVSLFFGKIADLMHNFNYPLFLLAAITCCGGLLWLLIDPTRQLKNAI
ncbi:MAG: MFS transporter [Bacteroidetes bacterium]|nr:MFS transporter [Bacteroidota bacterium]